MMPGFLNLFVSREVVQTLCALFCLRFNIGYWYPYVKLQIVGRVHNLLNWKTSMFIDWNLDTPPRKITATPLSYYRKWVEEDAMGKLWWFAMFIIFCIIFPVVAVITIGIMLAFIMGGSALWHRDTNSRRPAWLVDGFIGRLLQSLSVLCSRSWFFFGWRSFVLLSWAAHDWLNSIGLLCLGLWHQPHGKWFLAWFS